MIQRHSDKGNTRTARRIEPQATSRKEGWWGVPEKGSMVYHASPYNFSHIFLFDVLSGVSQ